MPSTRRRAESTIPVFDRLDRLARNLFWTWDAESGALFESLEPVLFEATRHNPIAMLRRLPAWRREALAGSRDFARRVQDAEDRLAAHLHSPSWHGGAASRGSSIGARVRRSMLAAYFCMEYGLHESLPLYAGGLGVLAGDMLKSASDLGVPLVAVGILWKCGYYRQGIGLGHPAPSGGRRGAARARGGSPEIEVAYPEADFSDWPVTDTGKHAAVSIGGRSVRVRIWRLDVGRVPLYLLDTDVSSNAPADRALTRFLYKGGDPEYRIRQEILLGIGGLAALDALGLDPDLFHLNEGHAAFLPLERVRRLVAAGAPFETARLLVKQSSVFTTHTPVPEGNDRFPARQVMRHFRDWPRELGVTGREFLALGRENPGDAREWFCMTVLALKLAERANGVSELHGETARRMWARVLDDPGAQPLSIGHVTNGVHPATWRSPVAGALTPRSSDEALWSMRQRLRTRMVRDAREILRRQIIRHGGDGALLRALDDTFSESALTVGFARRFALYKRGTLLFRDLPRLRRLVSRPGRPVQFLFSGKAHPIDEAGHEYARTIARLMRDPGLIGRVWIIEDYGLDVGRLLTAGCDVWLNNPLRPMEASGTSGMKGPLNGAINCSILDGWWAEACEDGGNGWAIGAETEMSEAAAARLPRAARDRLDARSLYDTLEHRVIPLFYARDGRGVPRRWVRMMRASMASLFPRFSSDRMVQEYVRDYYWPAVEESPPPRSARAAHRPGRGR